MDGLEHTANINTESTENKEAPLQVSDAIERLLANPDLLSTIASAIGAKSPAEKAAIDTDSGKSIQADAQKAQPDPPSDDISARLPELMSTVAPVIASLSGKGGIKTPDDDRSRLLYALKPYVNPHRREAIETIVQLSRISEIIRSVK